MIVADLRILTLGEGSSLEQPVERAVHALDDLDVRYNVGPMSTTIEADDLDTLMDAVKACHRAARENAPRVYTQFTIDDRRDKEETAESLQKLQA